MARGRTQRKLLLQTEEIEVWMDTIPNYIIKSPNEKDELYCSDISYLPRIMARFLLDKKLGKSGTYKSVKELGDQIINTLIPMTKWWDSMVNKLGMELILHEKLNQKV